MHAGTVNTSYAATLRSGERLFLRLYEQQDVEGARQEAQLLATLAARDVPTPCPIARTDGDAVSVLGAKALVVFPFLPGATPSQAQVSEAHTRAVGSALARLHLAVEGLPATEGRFGPDAIVALARSFRTHASCGVRDVAPFLVRELLRQDGDAARDPSLPGGLVHGDLFRDNVLFEGSRLTALLDFESAQRGSFAFDLAVVFLSWCYASSFDWTLGHALVGGYEEVRPLQELEWAGFFAEARFACLRFATTRIADDTWRVGKLYRRFLSRFTALTALGAGGLRERLSP